MSSSQYLPIDDSDSSSSVSHLEGRDDRSGNLTFWALILLCLCGFVIFRWTLICFPNGEKKNKEANTMSSFLLESPQSAEFSKRRENNIYPTTAESGIRLSRRTMTEITNCIAHCLEEECNRTISDCIPSCKARCMRSFSYYPSTKAGQRIQHKIPKGEEEGENRWLKKAHNDQNAGAALTNYKERRKVHCVCKFCMHVAEFCSMLRKHWNSTCGNDLQRCEIEHCGVDEICVQVVNDGMENDPVVATIRVLEICLDAKLFYS